MKIEKLRNYIINKGVKQAIIARSIGVSAPHLNMMLKGTRTMNPSYKNEILRFLEVKDADL